MAWALRPKGERTRQGTNHNPRGTGLGQSPSPVPDCGCKFPDGTFPLTYREGQERAQSHYPT